jgi:hypothetical protein
MQKMKLRINEEARGVTLSIPPYSQRLDQITDDECPSIFIPRRQVAVAPMPMVAQTMPPTGTGAAATSRGSTGGHVIVAPVGPYHHHISESRPPLISRAKKCAIVEFLARREFGLDTVAFLRWAWENETQARGCYERDSCTLSAKKLAEMLLLDGCLVLLAVFVLRKSSLRKLYPQCLAADISVSARTRGRTRLAQDFINLSADISLHMKQTRLDLLLLGNQIPFFVLDKLHSLLKDTLFSGIERSIQELALSCFDDIRPSPNPKPSPDLLFPPTVHHLLHLFHWSRVPPGKHAVDASSPLLGEPESNLPCATWFEDSGLSLSSKHAAAPGTLHMVFQRNLLGARGVLRVPALHIHRYSELVFHNLIAFEQSHVRCGVAVTTYSICMARLLQSEADAKLLRKRGILAHTHKTDKDIVDLFKKLGDEYRHDAFYSRDLLDLCKDVDAYHNSTPRAFKWLVLQCFPRQTVTFFVILGALISIATLINTVYSVYRFYHPAKK